MEKQLQDKVIILTGASEGIGRATALLFAELGACLVLAARSRPGLELVAEMIARSGGRALPVPTDVTDSKQVQALVDAAMQAHGRIDMLISNVGRGLRKAFVETTDEEWARLVAENLTGTVYCCRAVLPQMRLQHSGLIVNIASRSGREGEAGLAAYSAVKHGVVGLTRALALEEGPHGIRVNAVCPGPVGTERMHKILPQVDKSNWLTPEDVAQAILLVVTSAGHTMQGRTLDLF